MTTNPAISVSQDQQVPGHSAPIAEVVAASRGCHGLLVFGTASRISVKLEFSRCPQGGNDDLVAGPQLPPSDDQPGTGSEGVGEGNNLNLHTVSLPRAT